MAECKIPGHLAYELEAKAEEMPEFGVVTFENGHYPDEVVTYADIVIKGRQLAQALKNMGIGRGDVFALLMRNHPEFVYSLYAATLIGAVMLPVDPRTKGDRLRYILNDSKSRGLILTSEFLDNVEEVLPGLPDLKIVGISYKEGMPGPASSAGQDLAEIFWGAEVPPPRRPKRRASGPHGDHLYVRDHRRSQGSSP